MPRVFVNPANCIDSNRITGRATKTIQRCGKTVSNVMAYPKYTTSSSRMDIVFINLSPVLQMETLNIPYAANK